MARTPKPSGRVKPTVHATYSRRDPTRNDRVNAFREAKARYKAERKSQRQPQ